MCLGETGRYRVSRGAAGARDLSGGEGADVTERIRVGRGPRWLVLGLLSCGLSGPALARAGGGEGACREAPSKSDTESAKGAFRAGQDAFSEGDYGRAVQLWGQAYQEDCTAHALLLNLATAQELLGRPDEALAALRVFNRRAPSSPYVEANLKRIQRLERAVQERARLRARQARALEARQLRRPSEASDAAEPASTAVPLALAVTGAAVALTGGALYAHARYTAAQAADGCGRSPADCSNIEDVVDGERARSRAETAGWLAGAGLATAAGGLLWHLLRGDEAAGRDATQPSERWQPALAPTEASIHWRGTF